MVTTTAKLDVSIYGNNNVQQLVVIVITTDNSLLLISGYYNNSYPLVSMVRPKKNNMCVSDRLTDPNIFYAKKK